MKYISTRGQDDSVSFRDAVMTGLAPDGGLYLPEQVPVCSALLPELQALDFQSLFRRLVAPFVAGQVDATVLEELVQRSYAGFSHPEVVPVRQVGDLHVCELFHGPTLAFKDVALQFLGNLFEYFLARQEARLTIAGATSGDTGSAAIHALRGRRGIEVFILYPDGRVSTMQERQMTTVTEANIHPIAVRGSFDDAQGIVKALFNDAAFNAEVSLGAVNSINWARVMAQITYFFYAYFRVVEQRQGKPGAMKLGDPVLVAVPTGNFGHIYAGLLARRMGLPIERLILASNANAILHQLVETGRYRRDTVQQTLSPSMDIQVASNFERYLFDLAGGNTASVKNWMAALGEHGEFQLEPAQHQRVRQDLLSQSVDDGETLATIAEVHERTGTLLDPHSAIAFRAALTHLGAGMPVISMATAHPAKFAGAIRRAIGHDPELPPALANLERLPTRNAVLPAEVAAVRRYIRDSLPENINP